MPAVLFCCSICHVVPGLAKLLLPRINPFALIACAGAMALVVTHVLIDVRFVQLHLHKLCYKSVCKSYCVLVYRLIIYLLSMEQK